MTPLCEVTLYTSAFQDKQIGFFFLLYLTSSSSLKTLPGFGVIPNQTLKIMNSHLDSELIKTLLQSHFILTTIK